MVLSFAGGILISRSANLEGYWAGLGLFFLVAAFSVLFLFLPSSTRPAGIILLFLCTGMFLEHHSRSSSAMKDLAKQGARVTILGTVLAPPTEREKSTQIMLRTLQVFESGKEKEGGGEKIMVTVFTPAGPYSPGDRILFPAKLKLFKNFNNPGCYDREGAMALGGFTCAASVSEGKRIVPMGRGSLGFPLEHFEAFRSPIRDLLRTTLPPDQASVLRALILGEKQGIPSELREPFYRAGLGHVLVVSGLHVALVAWFAFAMLLRLMSSSYRLALQWDIRRLAAVLTCLPVVAYACLTGLEISCQRAMIMVLVYLFSVILGKEKETWSTLALAGLLVLALEPLALFSLSFQLSFSAVVGILWLGPPLRRWLSIPARRGEVKPSVFQRFYLYFAALVAVTLAATVFLLPLTTHYFHRFSWVVIPANITVLPLLGLLVLPIGLFAAASYAFSPSLSETLLKAAAWGSERMMDYVRFWGSWPWSESLVISPNSAEVLLMYSVMFFAFFAVRFGWAKRGLLIVLLLLAGDITYWVHRNFCHSALRVTFLDVGQGNAALVQFPGSERMLIDGGGSSDGSFDVGKMVVAPFLLRNKIARIDTIVLSHPDMDHLGGLRFIASHFSPAEFWQGEPRTEVRAYEELMKVIRSRNIAVLSPGQWEEDRMIGGVAVALLHPRMGDQGRRLKPNDRSLVIKLTYQGKSFLFPGDLEKAGEDAVRLSAGADLRSDVLLAPHHGSRTSCSWSFLQQVRPRVCVISAGLGNPWAAPSMGVVKRLESLGCRIFRTDRDGAVEIIVQQERGTVRPFVKEKHKGTGRSSPFMF